MQNIFISYGRRDASEIAEILSNRLRALKYGVFRDKDSIVGSQQWREALTRNILNSNLMVVLVTEAANDSDYVYQEILAAEKNGKPILPVQINGTKLPVYLRKWQAIEFTNNNYSDVILEIKRALEEFGSAQTKPDRKSTSRLVATFVSIIAFVALVWLAFSSGIITGGSSTATSIPKSPTSRPSDTPIPATYTSAPTQTTLPIVQASIFGQLLLAADFENARIPSDWNMTEGQWAIVSDGTTAALEPIGRSTIEFGDKEWNNYRLELAVRNINPANVESVWIDIRALPTIDRTLILALDFSSENLILISKDKSDVKEIGRVAQHLPQNEWFKMRIEAQGPRITIYMNDVLRMNKLIDTLFSKGFMRLRSIKDGVLFDNIRASSLENGTG